MSDDTLRLGDTQKPDDTLRLEDTLKSGDTLRLDDTLKPGDTSRLGDTLKPSDTLRLDGDTIKASGDVAAEELSEAVLKSGQTIVLNGKNCTIENRIKTSGEAVIYTIKIDGKPFILKHYKRATPLSDTAREVLTRIKNSPHERIIKIIDFGKYENQDYEIMEFAEGGTLDEYLRKNPIRDEKRLKNIIKMINEGLQQLHGKYNVIYQDLKPDNIFFTDATKTQNVLADFGISSVMETGDKKAQVVASLTDLYGAPELSPKTGHKYVIATPAVDYYSLGMTMLEMWLGEKPFKNIPITERDYLISEGSVDFPADMPDDYKMLIQGLIKHRKERWGDNQLQQWLEGKPFQQASGKAILGYVPEMFNDNESFSNPKELADLMEKYPEQGEKILYLGIIAKWFENSGRSLRAEEIKEVTATYAKDKQSGFYVAIYKIDASRPWTSKGGKACTSKEEMADALAAESAYYMEDLKKPKARLYQYFTAVDGANGEEVSKQFRKYFTQFNPQRALEFICLQLKDTLTVFADGSMYEGDLVDGTPHGKGKKTYADGNVYEGHFVKGVPHGKGKVTFTNGDIYEGDIVDGKYNGKGKLTSADGDVYEGYWVDNKMHGKGKFTDANGTVYEGDFVDDDFPGEVKITYAGGSVYEGDFADGAFNGKGKFTHKELGTIYEGDWVDEELNGKGKYTQADGSIYEGDFVDGEPNGKGKLTYANGDVYEGDFVDDERHGKGKLTLADGNVYEGDWVDDEFQGEVKRTSTSGAVLKGKKYTLANGDIYEGDIVDGKYNGKGKLTSADGDVYEGEFVNGDFHGKGKLTLADGTVYEGDFVYGALHGKGKYIFANGNVYEGDVVDGKGNGRGKFTGADGRVYEGDFVDGEPTGKGKRTFASEKVDESRKEPTPKDQPKEESIYSESKYKDWFNYLSEGDRIYIAKKFKERKGFFRHILPASWILTIGFYALMAFIALIIAAVAVPSALLIGLLLFVLPIVSLVFGIKKRVKYIKEKKKWKECTNSGKRDIKDVFKEFQEMENEYRGKNA